MVCHCVQCGARAAAISFPRGRILRPYAAFAWLILGRDATDLALESDQVDEGEGEVPAHQADKEDAIEEFRERAAADAAESDNDEHHGGVRMDGWTQSVKAGTEREKGRRFVCHRLREFICPRTERAVK